MYVDRSSVVDQGHPDAIANDLSTPQMDGASAIAADASVYVFA